MTELSITEARANLPSVVDRVIAGEDITLTRHGKPVVVLLRPDAVRARRAAAQRAIENSRWVRDTLAEAKGKPFLAPVMSAERAEQLVAEIRADRDRGR
ncbi:MAG: type II toxin-antitoxin system Phd/YefM family antitoxin [Sporichthyaceae bacterium]